MDHRPKIFADRADGIGFVKRIEVKSLDAELDQFLALAGGIFDPDLDRRIRRRSSTLAS